MLRHLSCFFTALAMLCAPSAWAQAVDWKTVDDWRISFYPGSQGCQAFVLYEEHTAFFIGFDRTRPARALDVTILDRRWSAIRNGTEYRVRLRFGSQPAWTLNMDGVMLNGLPGLHILIDASGADARQFVAQFQRERVMEWQHGETRLGRFPLTGSRRAFDEVRRCQEHHDAIAAATPPRPMARTVSAVRGRAGAMD